MHSKGTLLLTLLLDARCVYTLNNPCTLTPPKTFERCYVVQHLASIPLERLTNLLSILHCVFPMYRKSRNMQAANNYLHQKCKLRKLHTHPAAKLDICEDIISF